MYTDWQNLVNIGAKYANSRQEILDTLAQFPEMWDSPLSRIDMEKSHIRLTALEVRPINSTA